MSKFEEKKMLRFNR